MRWELAPKDPDGALRRYLATFSPEAVRRALALFAAKRASGRLDAEFAHRYLAKLVRSSQDEVELEIAERELERASAGRVLGGCGRGVRSGEGGGSPPLQKALSEDKHGCLAHAQCPRRTRERDPMSV